MKKRGLQLGTLSVFRIKILKPIKVNMILGVLKGRFNILLNLFSPILVIFHFKNTLNFKLHVILFLCYSFFMRTKLVIKTRFSCANKFGKTAKCPSNIPSTFLPQSSDFICIVSKASFKQN